MRKGPAINETGEARRTHGAVTEPSQVPGAAIGPFTEGGSLGRAGNIGSQSQRWEHVQSLILQPQRAGLCLNTQVLFCEEDREAVAEDHMVSVCIYRNAQKGPIRRH